MAGELEGWIEYKNLVLSQLQRLRDDLSNLEHKLDDIRSEELGKLRVDIALLKLKAGTWGAIAGLIPALVTALYVAISHKS